jgi:two-component system, NarL family, sensor histidine kinase DesK
MAEPGDRGTAAPARGRGTPTTGTIQLLPVNRSFARYLFTLVWFVYLIGPVQNLFHGHRYSPPWIAGGVTIAAAFIAVFLVLIFFCTTGRWEQGNPRVRAAYGGLFLLALLGCVLYGASWVTLWIFVSSATGWAIPFRAPVLRALGLVTGCYSLMAWVTHAGMDVFLSDLLPVAFIGLFTAGFRYQVTLVRELSQARETVAKLAASEERLRLARDMHDLTGQSLSVITLKSDLVHKLLTRLPPSSERDSALGEAADISRVSRQTLHDIREAVSGYRRPTLAVEIITAGTALESAGIELDDDPALTLRSGTFDGDAEAALAWCLREAVTNVIRHSGARHCWVRLTERAHELSLEVCDDGRGLEGLAVAGRPGGAPARLDPARLASAEGSGLRGMTERLASAGGRLSFGHATPGRGGRGLRVVATVPVATVAADAAPATPDAAGAAGGQDAAGPAGAAPPVHVPAAPE